MKRHNVLGNGSRGFTLIELVVAMGIFTVVMSLAVGAYVSIVQMKAMVSTMRESQEKTRIALETVTRNAKAANVIKVTGAPGDTLYLFFTSPRYTPTKSYKIYTISGGTITEKECQDYTPAGAIPPTCNTAERSTTLVSGVVTISPSSSFSPDYTTATPKLNITLNGTVNASPNPYYSDNFTLPTSVALENLQ